MTAKWALLRQIAQEEAEATKSVVVSEAQQRTALIDPQYCPHAPHPAQARFLSLDCREALYGGAAGGGKALYNRSMIPTPTGWTELRDLRPGSRVFDETGSPCNVLAISEVFTDHDCYEVVFDDGQRIVADAEHRWLTFTDSERASLTRRSDEYRQRRRASRPSRSTGKRPDLALRNTTTAIGYDSPPVTGGIRTTREIASTLKVKGRTNHSVPLASPICLPDADLPIPPYTLGLWLGDGNSRHGRVYVADEDKASIDLVRREGFNVRKIDSDTIGWCVLGLSRRLRLAGLFQNKHIPMEYQRASIAQRLELLRGLMDSDGNCDTDGGAEFCNTNERLARDVFHLACGLGIKATFTSGRAVLKGVDCGEKYRIKLTTATKIFHLERKRERQKTEVRLTQSQRYIVECNPVDSLPMQCIAVDSKSHLYLAGPGFIPTHNSDALLMGALQFVHVPGYAALILRRSYADLALPGAIMDRSQAWMRGSDATWNEQKKRWTFPSGASITFGYLEQDKDKYRYQGAEFQFIGFDELTQFDEPQYRYLLSRLRRTESIGAVPLRMRAASNPGGVGHQWVMERFPIPDRGAERQDCYIDDDSGRVFVPAKLADNPSLDEASYRENLADLDEATRKQLEDGDWHAVRGRFFSMWNSDTHLCPPFDIPAHWRMYGGLDWGYGAPMAFLLAAFDEEGVCYVVDELYLREKDDDDQAEMVKATILARGRSIRDVPIACDPSMWANLHVRRSVAPPARGERRIDAYLEQGLNVRQADNARVDGWANLRRYLLRNRLQVFSSRCLNLERTIPLLDPDKNNPDDVDTKQEDHAADALRYLLQQMPINAPDPLVLARKQEEREIIQRLKEAESQVTGGLLGIGAKKTTQKTGFFK